jgi:hypothetical protein
MPELSDAHEKALREVNGEIAALRERIGAIHAQTQYEDLEHAGLGLQIVDHAIEEVLEHAGLGGDIEHTPDPAAHRRATAWLEDVLRVQGEARALLVNHPNEDLETAIKALTITAGSLEEVVERYE